MALKVVAISGKAGSGKDTLSGFLADYASQDKIEWTIVSLADHLKKVCSVMFDVPLDYFYDRIKKNHYITQWGLTPRELAIRVGTDLVRNHMHEAVFKHSRDESIKDMSKQYSFWLMYLKNMFPTKGMVMIPDVRFADELEFLKRFFPDSTSIRVERDSNMRDTEELKHESENALDNFVFDYVVDNNGTLTDLKKSAQGIYNDIFLFHSRSMYK